MMRPGGPFAMPESEPEKVPGYWRDIDQSRTEARRLLRKAGVPDGFSFVLKSRQLEPHISAGVYLIDQWRQVGLKVEHHILETGPWTQDLRTGNYEVISDFMGEFLEDPDLLLLKYMSSDKNPLNYGGYTDRVLDDLYDRQSREPDTEKRKQLVWEFERRLLSEQVYLIQLLWRQRIIIHWAKFKGWKITPSPYPGQDLVDVWLAE